MKMCFRNALVVLVSLSCGLIHSIAVGQQATRDAAVKRVTSEIEYLASDELGGRLPGTDGIEKAAVVIEKAFAEAGLKKLDNGTYRQEFTIERGRELDPESAGLTIQGPNGFKLNLKYEDDFVPQVNRRNFALSGDLVFVGYGITADDLAYDEYSNVDVQDKIVVLIRREPQQENADSVFAGKEISTHAYVNTKVNAARKAGAAAIIMVNDGVTSPDAERDVLAASDQFGGSASRLPFFHVKRSVINKLLAKSPIQKAAGAKLTKLADIENAIDRSLEPLSQEFKGFTAELTSKFQQKVIRTSNIVGVLEGEGPHADETIIIGGHYDHLGMGAFGSRSPQQGKEIHNGADDNATGTVAVMELARMLGKRDKKPSRRIVFIAFTAEEMGLLGAYHYVKEPLFPLENTIAMINFDMIGWLYEDRQLTIFNYTSCAEFEPILESANKGSELELVKSGGFGGSDHLPFFQKQIPVMFFHTGLTSTYHTPEDDFATLDCPGAYEVIEYTEKVVDQIANLENKPTFVGNRPRKRVRLGWSLDSDHEKGVEVVNLTEDSIAAKAGLLVGDVITKVGGETTEDRRSVNKIIRQKAGKTITFSILRDGKAQEVEVTLK